MFILTFFTVAATVVYCSKIPTPRYGSLNTDDVVYNTLVTIQCNPGFMLDNGRVTKPLQCLDTSEWNDTVTTNCTRKLQFAVFVAFFMTSLQ